MNPYWDVDSVLFYIMLSIIGLFCMRRLLPLQYQLPSFWYCRNKYTLLWIITWTFFSVYRVVSEGIGGSDAISYIMYYKDCLAPAVSLEELHVSTDILFKWINQFFRLLSSDYHLYFIFIYAFIAIAYIIFLQRFTFRRYSVVPFILVFFLYLRSYTSIRSSLAGATILISLVSLVNKDYIKAYLWGLSSILIHKGVVLYALVIPFCHFILKHNPKPRFYLVLLILSTIFASAFRDIFVSLTEGIELHGAYTSYAMKSQEDGITNIVSTLGQIVLAVTLILYRKRIRLELFSLKDDRDFTRSAYILFVICLYDIILVPMNLLFGIWRGYEFFFLPRLCCWSIIIYLVNSRRNFARSPFLPILFICVFLFWFIYRLSRTFESSCLLPYKFDLFL